MPDIRFFFSSIDLSTVAGDANVDTERLLLTAAESLSVYDILAGWVKQIKEENVPIFDLPKRKHPRTGETVSRKILIPRVRLLEDAEVFIFHLWKVSSDIANTMIVDLEDMKVQTIRELAQLAESQGAVTHCVCAYDYKNHVLIWRDIDGISKVEIERLFQTVTDRKVKITLLADPNVDEDFDRMDVESLFIDLLVPDLIRLAKRLEPDENNRPLVARLLGEAARDLGSDRVRVTFFAEPGKTREHLRKEVIGENLGFLRAVLASMNVGKRPSERKRGRLKAEGSIAGLGKIDHFENRVIDLFEGVLIRKQTYIETEDINEIYIN